MIDAERIMAERSGTATDRFVSRLGATLDEHLASALEAGPDQFLEMLHELGMTRLADVMARGWVRHAAQVAATHRGIQKARDQGRVSGRRKKLVGAKRDQAFTLYDARELTVAQIAETVGTSRATIYRALREREAASK